VPEHPTTPVTLLREDFTAHETRVRALPEEKQRGDAFEQLVQRFLERDPAIRSGYGIAKTWLWAEWPDRYRYYPQEPEGLGVDHVIESTDGNLIAVQAKFVSDPTNATRYEDLASFINRVTSPGSPFSGGLLVSNAFSLSRKVEREFAAAHDPTTGRGIGVALRDILADSSIDWSPAATLAPRAPYTRMPHQLDAITDTVRTLADHDRTRLIAACGTGKTLMSYWVARDLAAERILVLLPSLALVRQFRMEWAEAASRDGWSPAVYAVCSENDRAGTDAVLMRADELGVRMLATPDTDPAVIAGWLRRPGPAIVFSTYQSSPRIAEAMSDAAIAPFDLIVADEAHNIVSAESGSAFRTLIDGDRLRARKRLFMTATEKIYSDRLKRRAEDEGVDLVSMDDETQFGPLAHQISFGRAIEEGLITDYKIVIAEISEDDPELAEFIAQRRFVDADGLPTTDAATLAAGLALSRAAQELGFRRMISFHTRAKRGSGANRTAGAEAFAELLGALEPSWRVAFVSGEQPTATRADRVRGALTLTEGERGLVTNARCLGEGVDLPDLEAVAFVDPRSSVIDIVQSASRALRKSRTIEKPLGYILIPVTVPIGVDPEAALTGDAYAQLYRVVRAMRSHDERLAEEIDGLRLGRGVRSGAAGRLEGLVIRTGELGSRTIDLVTWRSKIAISIVDQTYDGFAVGLAELTTYHAEHAHARVPRSYRTPSGYRLGKWVGKQREAYNASPRTLSPERIADLETLGMIWDAQAEKFAAGLAELTTYRAEHSDARVPDSYRAPSGYPLGQWVGGQREAYNASPRRLSPERIADLETLGMIWDELAEKFAAGLAALAAYQAEHGHARVPDSYRTPSGYRLGEWVGGQREAYNASPRRIGPERIADLEALGMIWDELAEKFAAGLAELAAYRSEHGDARVPKRYRTPSGYPLGQWVGGQREAYNASPRRLSPERIADLESLGMIWDTLAEAFAVGLAELTTYRAEHGDARVPRGYCTPSGYRLGKWVDTQRVAYNASPRRISPERIADLEALGMLWKTKR
jgi:superfamily II DNA or RNA helicase